MNRICSRLITRSLSTIASVRPVFEQLHLTRFPGPVLSFNQCFSKHESTLSYPTAPIASGAHLDVTENDPEIVKVLTNPQVISILGIMQQLGFNETEIRRLMINQPTLQKTRQDLWSDIIGTLVGCDFENSEILSMLERWPNILLIKKHELIKRLNAWTESGFGEKLLFEVLAMNPNYLGIDDAFISKRIKQYQIYFGSKKRVGKLFLLAPNTLEESWITIVDKLNYLDELCTDKSDIVSTGVLAHSFFHIQSRHEFLIRAGIYKRPTKTFNKKLSKNPKLELIVNTSDDDFVSKIARLSKFEYEVFLEIFKEEMVDIDAGYDSDDVEMYKLSYKKNGK